MYSGRNLKQQELEGIVNDFNIKLDSDNRWVKMSRMIPWGEIEEKYAKTFRNKRNDGRRAKRARVAIGSLLVQQILKLTDRETVQMIKENPYIQYFLGYNEFRMKAPFDASTMVHFRKRFSVKIIAEINDMILEKMRSEETQKKNDDDDDDITSGQNTCPDEETKKEEKDGNQGKLMLDATCVPADIRYPTDLSLLNEGREKIENMIDIAWEKLKETGRVKPRTYRLKARKSYLATAKKPGHRGIRNAIKSQLQYLGRDLNILDELLKENSEREENNLLNDKQTETVSIIRTLYTQQKQMHESRIHRIKDRIVSISQFWVRPIVRGKAKSPVEFGAKLEISVVDGFTGIEKISWDNFNEGQGLIESVERYRAKYGYYPESVLADKLYRNRKNLEYCKEHGIRLSGPRLGRPPKDEKKTKEHKKLEYLDTCERNAVEGKFGEGKRRYTLELNKMKLRETSETSIGMNILTMNIMAYYRRSLKFLFIFFILSKISDFFDFRQKFASKRVCFTLCC